MFERLAVGLGVLLFIVPMSLIGAGASGSMIGAKDDAIANHARDALLSNISERNDNEGSELGRFEQEQTESAQTETTGGFLSFASRLARRLFWTATTASVALVPVAEWHAKWTGQEEAYRKFRQTLLADTWSALRAMPEGIVASFTELPALASAIRENPSLVIALGVSMLEQTLEAAYTFATSESDEEAAAVAASVVADMWFGKLVAAGGLGARLIGKRATRIASALSHADDGPGGRLRLATAGFCFVGGTPVHTSRGARAIENIALGDRVATAQSARNTSIDVDARWKRIELVIHDERSADGKVHIALLRSPKWIEETGAKVGGEIDLALEEMGVRGMARVLSIQPSPPISEGPGRVVLATIRSKSTDVMVLGFRETNETLEPTAGHRLYSVDRAMFVAARELRVGEQLRTQTGRRHARFDHTQARNAHCLQPRGRDRAQLLRHRKRGAHA